MVTCDVCGKPFLLKAYLKNHVCEAVEEKEETTEEYETLTKKELVQLAKDSGVKGSDRMSKDDIIEALK
jgi:hypothetical protein